MKPLRKRAAMLRMISALLVFSLSAPYGVVFSAPGKEKVLFLGVLDKDNAWISNESLKWFKMSLLSTKYEWTSVESAENLSGALSPSDFQNIAETYKQENTVKIIYGKINETETAKKKNGAAVNALFYIYDTASKSAREVTLTGLSPQKPGYSGSEELLYNEALKDLSSELVSFLDENVSPAERDAKKLATKKTKKSSSHRHSYFEDDNIFGSDFLDMVMGAALLYMVFFHRSGGSGSSSSGCGPTFEGTGNQRTCVFPVGTSPWSISYELAPQKQGDNYFRVHVLNKNGNTILSQAILKEDIAQSDSGSSLNIVISGEFVLDIMSINVLYKLTVQGGK